MSMFKSGIAKDIFGNINSAELKEKGIAKLKQTESLLRVRVDRCR